MHLEQDGEVRGGISARLLARQARVGIVPNPIQPFIPAHPPREVWVRWPKLRSARRSDGGAALSRAHRIAHDPVLNGEKLQDHIRELRAARDGDGMRKPTKYTAWGSPIAWGKMLAGLLIVLACGWAAFVWWQGLGANL